MRLFRSIGENELKILLFQEGIVSGKYQCTLENQNTNTLQNAVCFFLDEIRWKDSEHELFIVVDIPSARLQLGVGQYAAKKSLKKTQIWNGKSGSYSYGLREAYTEFYSAADVKELYIFDHYNWEYKNQIQKACQENNIVFHRGTGCLDKNEIYRINEAEFVKYGCQFVADHYNVFDYISEEFACCRDNIAELSEVERQNMELLNDVRTKVTKILGKGDEEAIKLAKEIQKIL